jgi:hypothetical protein
VVFLVLLALTLVLIAQMNSERMVYQDDAVTVYEKGARVVIPGIALGVPAGKVELAKLELRRLRMVVTSGEMLARGYAYLGKIANDQVGAWLEIEAHDGDALLIAVPKKWKPYLEAILGALGAGDSPTETKENTYYVIVAFYGQRE